MRRVISCCSVVILLAFAGSTAFAGTYDYTKEDLSGYSLEPNLKVSDEPDFSRNGRAVYFDINYLYTIRLLSSTPQSIVSGSSTLTYVPKNVFPSNFHGFLVGVGKEWSRRIDLQLAFLQSFRESKTSVSNKINYTVSTKRNGLLADIAFVCNPDDQFQVLLKGGALLEETYDNITASNATYYPVRDDTRIDPALGLEFLFQFSKHFGLRLNTVYVADAQSSNSHGEINAYGGLSYAL